MFKLGLYDVLQVGGQCTVKLGKNKKVENIDLQKDGGMPHQVFRDSNLGGSLGVWISV